MVVFHDPDATLALNPAVIAQLHGLTPAEARVAAALVKGDTLAQYAEQAGCSEDTARTHMKRILDKTGASRQADLVRILLSSAALRCSRP